MELQRILRELVDPDSPADSFLGPEVAPLVQSVKVAYEACSVPPRDWHEEEKRLADVEAVVVPVIQDFEERHRADSVEEVLVGTGIADEATRSQNQYGIAALHANPLFGIIVALDFQKPSAGQKVLILPQFCADLQMSMLDYDQSAKAWCLSKLNNSKYELSRNVEDCSEDVLQDLQVLNKMSEGGCVAKLASVVQDQEHGGMGAHASVGVGAGATPFYMHELQDLATSSEEASHDLGFNLQETLQVLGVPEGVQVYVPGGRSALAVWGKKVMSFFEDAEKAKMLLEFLRMHMLVHGLKTHLGGSSKHIDRRQECTPKIKTMFPWLIARKFVEGVMSPEKRAEAAEVAWQLVAAFADNLDRLSWLTPITRKRAKEKLRNIDIKTGYPDWIFHDHQLVRRYGYALNFKPGMSWTEMSFTAGFKNLARFTEQIAIPIDSHSFWVTTPDTTNMMYETLTNDVALLAAFMQEPNFDTSTPMSFSFGYIGSIIGHELTHGFDPKGARRGPTGDLHNWWDDSSHVQFDIRKECFVKQYSTVPLRGDDEKTGFLSRQPTAVIENDSKWNCEAPSWQAENYTLDSCAEACWQKGYAHLEYWEDKECECIRCTRDDSQERDAPPFKLVEEFFDDGAKCLTENIADSGGLGLAHLAYMQWRAKNGEEPALAGLEEFTADQLFFMRFGAGWCHVATDEEIVSQVRGRDPHAVNRLRVLGAVQNSRSFAAAFSCPVGAAMNPEEKCEIWGIEAAQVEANVPAER